MPVAPTIPRDPALEAHVFWYRFRREILALVILVLLALIGFAAYRFYSDRRELTASALLASAKTSQEYEKVIARYAGTSAGASAYLLLAQAQRNDRKFAESNTTLQVFIDKNPKHELVPAARMAIAANLESTGKMDEALAMYQRVVADYPKSFAAPLALISQVAIYKTKKQDDAARRACETILTQYRESLLANEAMRELRSLKPSAASGAPAASMGAPNALPPMLARPPMASPGRPAPAAAPTAAPAKPK